MCEFRGDGGLPLRCAASSPLFSSNARAIAEIWSTRSRIPAFVNAGYRMSGQKKDIALEALRGMAAISVVLGHSWVTFYAPGVPMLPQLLHILVNGAGAVVFFFVLSGYVLTKRFVETENYRSLANSVLKRWFRLLGPVTLSFLISAALFRFSLYHYKEMADYLHSPWLRMFGYSIPDTMDFHPSFHDALVQGAFYTFFYPDHHYYNSPVGTIYFESLGSFLIFGLAFAAVLVRKAGFWLAIAFLICAGWGASFYNAYYTAFVAGLAMSVVFHRRDWHVPPIVSGTAILIALYLFNLATPDGLFAWVRLLGNSPDRDTYICVAASVLLIVGVERNTPVHRILSTRAGAFLGRLSFPIYLVHFLVMCSLGCYTWLTLQHTYGRHAAMLAIPVTFVGSVIVALPIIRFDRWWTANVNRIAASIIPPRRISTEREKVEAELQSRSTAGCE